MSALGAAESVGPWHLGSVGLEVGTFRFVWAQGRVNYVKPHSKNKQKTLTQRRSKNDFWRRFYKLFFKSTFKALCHTPFLLITLFSHMRVPMSFSYFILFLTQGGSLYAALAVCVCARYLWRPRTSEAYMAGDEDGCELPCVGAIKETMVFCKIICLLSWWDVYPDHTCFIVTTFMCWDSITAVLI